jgi:hypothetical protein
MMRASRLKRALLIGSLALALISCGGGGGGGDSGTSPSNPPSNPTPPTTVTVGGIASYTRLNASLDPASLTRYTVQVDLVPFNATTYDPASISNLRTTAVNLQVLNGGTVLGQQRYSLQSVTCNQGGGIGPYSAVMLFDRSGSMASNDPADDTLAAAREFVNRMERIGQAWIAAFPGGVGLPGRPTSPVTFYGTGFIDNKPQLLADIAAVGAPAGNTPLWDSMIESIFKFPTFAASPGTARALLAFSDGEDNASSGSPTTVQSNALQRSVKVFAINLRNSNSHALDSVALATGGAVYSTDEARNLIAFYGTLGKLLSGSARTCSATIAVDFVPNAGVGEVAYGPGGTLKDKLQFDGTSGASTPLVIETQLTLPLYPGRRVGQTLAGRSVYETDSRLGNTDCVQLIDPSQTGGRGPLALNACTAAIWLALCDSASPTTCRRGVVQPGDVMSAFASSRSAQCPWNEPMDKYESVIATGTAPGQLFTAWTAASQNYTCVNTARGPF